MIPPLDSFSGVFSCVTLFILAVYRQQNSRYVLTREREPTGSDHAQMVAFGGLRRDVASTM